MGYLRHARTYDRSETRDRLRARAYGDGATIVVVGVTPHHGDGNTASQGEGWQVTTRSQAGEVREMRTAATVLSLNEVTGEPRETETLMRGSERGRQKSPSTQLITRWRPTLPQDYGVLIVLVGVTPHQGARESRAQGEVAQVVGCPGAVRYARCGTPKQERALCERCSQEATGELLEIERLTSSLERGHWKSTREGNSPVAYSTSRTGLTGGLGRRAVR